MNNSSIGALKATLDELRLLTQKPEYLSSLVDGLEELLLAKGDDHSGEANTFNNFILAKTLVNVHPELGMRYLIALKIGRLINIASKQTPLQEAFSKIGALPNFESEWQNWQDLLGYAILMLAYIKYTREKHI